MEVDLMFVVKMYYLFFVYYFYEKFLSNEFDGFLIKYEILFRNYINLFMDYFKI